MWTASQAVLSKLAVLAATWAIAFKLSEDDVAIASLVTMLTKFFTVLPPFNMGDVLVARGESFRAFVAAGFRIALRWSLITLLIVVLAMPLVLFVYGRFPPGALAALLGASLVRVVAEAFQVGPLVTLRMAFRYRAIALADGATQLGGSLLSVVLAFQGAAAWALVLPIAVVAIVKVLAYRTLAGRALHLEAPPTASEVAELARGFRFAGGAQYVHSVVDTLPILMLGRFAVESETGLFAFAFNLAAQANAVLGGQLSGVLQPVLVSLSGDVPRQVRAFLRTLRVLSAVVVPVCLCQAVFAENLFHAVLPARWQPAVPVFAAISLSEAFFFAAAPTMALLRAQGRFQTFLYWQLAHACLLVAALPFVAKSGGAVGVALLGMVLWAISLPCAVFVCVRPHGVPLRSVIAAFVSPWMTTLPVAVVALVVTRELGVLGRLGDAIALLVLAPCTLVAMLFATKLLQPDVFAELRGIFGGAVTRFQSLFRVLRVGRGS
jgi:O-antigen/teichoic acid export membrane protein